MRQKARGFLSDLMALAVLILLTACSSGPPPGQEAGSTPAAPLPVPVSTPDEAESAWLDRGAGIVQPFKMELKSALMSAMAKGPSEAINACRLEAPAIAERMNRDGIRIGRTSHRLRNPSNRPPEWVQPLLTAAVDDAGQSMPRTLRLGADRVGYIEPITVQKPCLMCHGSSIAEPVAQRIARLYPDDEATGFAAGDFRGMFWVEFPVPE